ncbi:MAG: FAD-binding oxidoreductase [Rhodobacteraceae bacterium]|nr:FAD-binding oxidoreductase [Paracoccaceae bacterium]
MEKRWDVIVVGGAVLGASVAFWLSRLSEGRARVLVVERDPSFARASTALSVASIRLQFTNPVNVAISRMGVDFIRRFAEETGLARGEADLGLKENGYLFLASDSTRAARLEDLAAMQRAHGAGTLVLSRAELGARLPWMNVGDVEAASLGPRDEGWFDNMGLVSGLRRAAEARGVRFLRDEATALQMAGPRVTGVHLAGAGLLQAGAVVNAAGTSAAIVARWAGVTLPVEPRKRTVFVVDAPDLRAPGAPLIVDHQGLYLRPEGPLWLCAASPEEEDGPADPDDFTPDHAVFEDRIWPMLHHRSDRFARLKVLRAWAGHYAYNTLDQNALVGHAPGVENLYLCNGFSGHGLQQAPAVGRGMAELVLTGRYQTLDLAPLDPMRVVTGRPFLEEAIV